MSYLWNWCKRKTWRKEQRIGVFLAANTVLFGLLGAAVWGIVRVLALKEISWLFCFAGYAGFAPGYIGGIFFLWNNVWEKETHGDE